MHLVTIYHASTWIKVELCKGPYDHVDVVQKVFELKILRL